MIKPSNKNIIALVFSLCTMACLHAQTIHFEALKIKGAQASKSSFVKVDAGGVLATVVELGSDVNKATLELDGKKIPLKFLVYDLESRVALYQLPEESAALGGNAAQLGASLGVQVGAEVYLSATDHSKPERVASRVYRFQGKVLPLAVLRLNHNGAIPPAGSGIYDGEGKLIGLVRQAVYESKTSSYCLPAEVIARVRLDHKRNGNTQAKRCWIGIIMDELVAAPIVESVRPDSPATKAGLKNGDLILAIGERKVHSYAEVVDAFYYLVAGVSKKFRVLRGTEVMEFDITPEVSPSR